jgi:hypothetical protein
MADMTKKKRICAEKTPNKITIKAMEEALKGRTQRAKNFEDICKHIKIV